MIVLLFVMAAVMARISISQPGSETGEPVARTSGVYYRNCAAAWAAGAAPISMGQPGYRPELDGDDDGIACEPFHRAR